MDILGKARQVESRLAKTFDNAAQQWSKSGPRTPLELLQAIVDAAEEGLEPAGRGTRVFPFNRIKVSIVAPTRDARTRFAALSEGEPTLLERIQARLRAAGSGAPGLQIKLVFVDRPAPNWTHADMHVEFDRVNQADIPREKGDEPESIRITVLAGSTEKPSYVFAVRRVNLGRCTEVRDSQNHLIRTNHVAFSESTQGPNPTVSRRHAYIEYTTESRQYRVCDDGSAHGTAIIRNGRTIRVPSGARGIRLRSGDELLLGEARLRVRIESA
ncbi:MAG: FHA domain-containing protein [Acidobacteriota bacterium]